MESILPTNNSNASCKRSLTFGVQQLVKKNLLQTLETQPNTMGVLLVLETLIQTLGIIFAMEWINKFNSNGMILFNNWNYSQWNHDFFFNAKLYILSICLFCLLLFKFGLWENVFSKVYRNIGNWVLRVIDTSGKIKREFDIIIFCIIKQYTLYMLTKGYEYIIWIIFIY